MSSEPKHHTDDRRLNRAVILTAISIEFSTVRKHLSDPYEVRHPEGTVYDVGEFTANGRTWEVLIAEIGTGNPKAAIETERAIRFFKPSVAFFVGIAGGVKDVTLGDVVAATKVYGYESGKAELEFLPRPSADRLTYVMEQRARAEKRKDNWRKRILTPSTKEPTVHLGPIAAGEKVIASTRSPVYQFLKATYNDTLTVEMEGQGFVEAIHANQSVAALIIRGISDLLDDKESADESGSQDIAARHASAFAFEVLANLEPPEISERTIFEVPEALTSASKAGNVPPRPPLIIGRINALSELKARLGIKKSDAGSNPTQVMTAVRGWPGVGKTTIAATLAHEPDIYRAFPDGVL